MDIGKLPNKLLNELIIDRVKKQPSLIEVLTGPSVGEDCALLDFGGDLILLSTDPITAAENGAARLLINICANDIAASGGTPVGIAVTALFPPDITEQGIKSVMDELLYEAGKLGIALIGGHTEITDAVNRTVLSGAVLGRVDRGKQVSTAGAKRGDKILITKYAGLEGTAILAGEFEQLLQEKFGQAFVESAKNLSQDISVIEEAKIAKKLGASSMHDITEGGVLGACAEAAEACGLGFSVDLRKINVKEETRGICEYLHISPYELISSGSLLITAKNGERLASALELRDIKCTVVGEVMGGESRLIGEDGEETQLIAPPADAVYRAIRFGRELMKKTVLFVCTGNTCRSPMAEGFANRSGKSGYNFTSRGICADGSGISKPALEAMKRHGVDMTDFRSAEIIGYDVECAHLILTMTETHKRLLLERYGDKTTREKTFTLREFAYGGKKNGDIRDPFGLGMDDYVKCAAEIKECVNEAVKRL